MNCPVCKTQALSKSITTIPGMEVSTCPQCHGTWFEKDTLQKAIAAEDENAKWLNIELWDDLSAFQIKEQDRLCPKCNIPLYQINYNHSDIKLDACKECNGLWVDKNEFDAIVQHVKDKAGKEILDRYTKHLVEDAAEVFTGHKSLHAEVEDFTIVAKLLETKFLAQHPVLSQLFINLPFTK